MVRSIDLVLGQGLVPDSHLGNVTVEITVVRVGITYPEYAAAVFLVVMLGTEVQ